MAKKVYDMGVAMKIFSLSPTTLFHGTLGDKNPIEHSGGVIYEQEGTTPEVIYFKDWTADDGSTAEPRVTVCFFDVNEDILDEFDWVDWDSVASFLGMELEELEENATSKSVCVRAQVIADVGNYYGFSDFARGIQEMTVAKAEAKYGEFVDQAAS